MQIKGLIKRLAPFFLTFALGLFVASFFVTVALPNVRFNRVGRKHREYHRKMEFDNQRLREENLRLKQDAEIRQQIEQNKIISETFDFNESGKVSKIRIQKVEETIDELVPPPPPLVAPVRPTSHRR